MTNNVTEAQLKGLAELEEKNRLAEMALIELRVSSGVLTAERELSASQALAEKTRNELLEQQRAYVAEFGKLDLDTHVKVRAQNHWVYDEDEMLEKLLSDEQYKRFVRINTDVSIIKGDLKVYLGLTDLDEAIELGATWVEEYTVDFKPLGDLVV